MASNPRLRVATAYAGENWSTRAHLALRKMTAPFSAVESELPASGRVLEIGCGHGVFSLSAATTSPTRRLVGVDIDEERVASARRAASTLGLDRDRARFTTVPPGWSPDEGAAFDAVVVIDVLYLLGVEPASELVRAAAAAVSPGGVLLVKEMDTTRRVKATFTKLQELAALRIVGLTMGDVVELIPLSQLEREMRHCGLSVQRRRLDRFGPWPHALLVGRRPVTEESAAGSGRQLGASARCAAGIAVSDDDRRPRTNP